MGVGVLETVSVDTVILGTVVVNELVTVLEMKAVDAAAVELEATFVVEDAAVVVAWAELDTTVFDTVVVTVAC